MPNTIKNVYLKKKIDGAIVTIYPHTDAGVTSYVKGDTTTTVAAELERLASGLSSVSSESDIKGWIETAKNEILGITDGDTIDQAYDTLKEVADYLAGTDGAAAALARIVGEVEDDTTGLLDRMTAAEDSISDLETTVGGFKSGLVKDVADIQTDIGDDSTAASVKGRIAALEAYTQVTMTSTDPTALTADDNTLYIVYEEESVPVVDPTGTV